MALIPEPASSTLPAADAEIIAEPLTGWITNIKNFIEAKNMTEANVNTTAANGIMGLSVAQTVTGAKTFSNTNIILSGTTTLDMAGIADSLILDADNDTTISAPTDDQIDFEVGGLDVVVMTTGVTTFNHPVTVGVDDTGYDVQFFGATASKYFLWDESANKLIIEGDFEVTGTSTGTGLSFANDANNRIVTGDGSGGLNGEANLTFDGTTLQVGSGIATPNVNGDNLVINGSGNTGMSILGDTTSAASIIYLGYDGDEDSGRIFYQNSATAPFMDFYAKDVQSLRITSTAVAVTGALSKGSGSFKIRHPLPEKSGYDLVHSFIEGPQADLIYRGVVALVDGAATVNIDTAGRMTDGTFVALCTNVQSFTSNESNDDCVRGSVSGNILTITSSNAASTASISWMVIGERKDAHMLDTEWTDENGRVITEPLTDAV